MARSLTQQQFIDRSIAAHTIQYDYTKTVYTKNSANVTITCPQHGDFVQIASKHMDGANCPECALHLRNIKGRGTTESFIEKARAKHGDKYTYERTVYVRADEPVIITCPTHGDFTQIASYHLNGYGCHACAGVVRYTYDNFVERATKVHEGKYAYPEQVIANSKTRVTIICPVHGEFTQQASSHISGMGCAKCADEAKKHRQLSLDEFIKLSRTKHGDKYDYSLVNYVDANTPVTIICPVHGAVEVHPYKHHHLGSGCKKCAGKHRYTQEEFVEKLKTISPQLEVLSQYKSTHAPIDVKCVEHNHEFSSTPRVLLSGTTGCPDCIRNKRQKGCMERYGTKHHKQKNKTPDQIAKFNNRDWLYEQHVTNKRTVVDIAKELNYWDSSLLTKMEELGIEVINWSHTCSGPEREIDQLVQSLGFETITRNRTLIAPLELDIYVPELKLAIEYCGLYWHSDKFKERSYHANKLKQCQKAGIRLITIFEDEWEQRKSLVVKKLTNIMGKSAEPTVFARKCSVVSLTTEQKRKFLDANHIQGDGPGSISYGLMHSDALVAVMSFIVGQNGKYTLNRFATSCKIPGGFSKLLSHFKKNHNWQTIVSFADLRWSVGSLYEQNGFVNDKVLVPDYYYCYAGVRHHKFKFRHSNLHNILGDVYDPAKSEWENMKDSKYDRIWNCGLIRYIQENKHVSNQTS